MLAERCRLACLVLVFLAGATAADSMLGGFNKHEDPSNDAAVQQAAEFAVEQIDKSLKLERIIEAHKQVVAGMNFKLQLQTSGGSFEATVFKGLGDGPYELKTYQKLDSGSNAAGGRGQLGGAKQLSTNDGEVQQAARAALDQLSGRSNSLRPFQLKEVVTASSRVHGAGMEFQLQLRVAQGDMPETTLRVDITRTLENAQYRLGEVSKVGPASQ